MTKFIILLIISVLTIFNLAGCSTKPSAPDNKENNKEEPKPIVQTIDAKEAKEMMDATEDIIILDVRTEEEFNSGHIEGAILIPDNEIEEKAEVLLKDKSATILVYCRSGRRSALASQNLCDLGYSAIYDFGGIIDWPYSVEN